MSRWLQLVVLMVLAWVGPRADVLAGPAIDPRAMSGIPRPDPQLAAGSITVRVLDGGFDAPAVGATVTLELTKGSATETRTATADAQGRATFDGLSSFTGGTAIAKTERSGEPLVSQPIELLADAGSRVMLVAGATGNTAGAGTTGGGAAPRHGQPGGPEVPMPGTAFALDGTPAGDLVVGTFDLDARKPLPGIEVTLDITKPDGTTEQRKATSDDRGKVDFEKLGPPALPSGTKLVVSAVVVAGQPAQRSAPFEMGATVGMAVVLAKGQLDTAPPPPQRPRQRTPVPGPRGMPSLPTGTVRARVVDAQDRPVAGQPVVVVKKDATKVDVEFFGETGPDGTVDVVVRVQSDAIYLVETIYDGAPYRSGFFQVDRKGGIAADLRVFETTGDVSRVRSVVQFDIDGLENDVARVVQVVDVMVTGDEAFWPPGGMRFSPAREATEVKVMGISEEFLAQEDEKQPWATLAGPIPPGELVRLAIAYVVEHDGEVKLHWTTPFGLLESGVLVGPEQRIEIASAKPSEHPSPIPGKTAYDLGERAPGTEIEVRVSGFVVRPTIYRYIGGWIATFLVGLTMALVVLRPSTDVRARLVARRDELLGLLEQRAGQDPARRTRVITALDRVYRQLDALPKAGASGARDVAAPRWLTLGLLVAAEGCLVYATIGLLELDWLLDGLQGGLITYIGAIALLAVAVISRRRLQLALYVGFALFAARGVMGLLEHEVSWHHGWLYAVAAAAFVVAAVRGLLPRAASGT